MPRKKVPKSNRANFNAEQMKSAVEDVLMKKMSVRASAKANNVDRTTLTRYVKDAKDEYGNYKPTPVFFLKLFVTTQVIC